MYFLRNFPLTVVEKANQNMQNLKQDWGIL